MPRPLILITLMTLAAPACHRPTPQAPLPDRLVAAVRADSLAAVLALLDQGEDPNRRAADGSLPLGEAIRLGHDTIAVELLRSGAVPADTDAAGFAAFDRVMVTGDTVMADRLIRAAVIAAGGGPRVLAWFDDVTGDGGPSPDWRDVLSGELLSLGLMSAALHGRVDLIGAMRRAREIPNRTGYHALSVAARWGRDEAVWALLGIDTHPDLIADGRWRSTPLMEAARDGHLAVARRLLHAGARVNRRDAFGETALHWAARSGHVEYVRLLLGAGADRGIRSLGDSTAAQVAAAAGHDAVAALLAGSPAS